MMALPVPLVRKVHEVCKVKKATKVQLAQMVLKECAENLVFKVIAVIKVLLVRKVR